MSGELISLTSQDMSFYRLLDTSMFNAKYLLLTIASATIRNSDIDSVLDAFKLRYVLHLMIMTIPNVRYVTST